MLRVRIVLHCNTQISNDGTQKIIENAAASAETTQNEFAGEVSRESVRHGNTVTVSVEYVRHGNKLDIYMKLFNI